MGRLRLFFSQTVATKVPQVTIYFWVIKILTTGMGETTSDFLVRQFSPIIAIALGGLGFIISLLLQFFLRRYIPWVYWLTVIMVAIFGTMVADVLHVGFGIPYIVSTCFFLLSLLVIFSFWFFSEKTLSIHSIYTRKRELFYWAAIITTFALGTAAGDMTATTLQLGYFSSGILFAFLFLLPFLATKFFKTNEVVTFWFAYIMTRPLGASFADWMGRSQMLGGIGWGTGRVSFVLAVMTVVLVSYISIQDMHKKKKL